MSVAYFDKETNLHYNYFRDYDPSIGRYGESDPIGLKGGLNTYVYALDDPMRKVDPFGLDVPQMYPFVERMLQVPRRRLCECKSDRTGAAGEAIKNFMAGGAAAGGTTGLAYGIAHTGAHLGAAAGTGAVGAAGAAALGGKMAVTGLVLGMAGGACIGIAVAGVIYFAPSMCLCEPEPIYFP